MKRLLILGLDPGTTVGYAFLDIDGNNVAAGEEKNLNLSGILARCVSLESVVLVGTDKAKTPEFVRRVAANLDAPVEHPDNDLTLLDKKEMIRHDTVHGQHASDALAAARYAWRRVESLAARMQRKKIPSALHEDILDLVLKQQFSIEGAYTLLTQPEQEVFIESIKDPQKITPETIKRIAEKLSCAQEDNARLKKLLHETRTLQLKAQKAFRLLQEQRIRAKPVVDIQRFERSLRIHEDEIRKLLSILNQTGEYIVLPKITGKEKEIPKGWIFLDKDEAIPSFQRIASVCAGVVLRKQPLVPLRVPFAVFENVKFETENHVILDRAQFTQKVQNQTNIGTLLSEYRKNRREGLE